MRVEQVSLERDLSQVTTMEKLFNGKNELRQSQKKYNGSNESIEKL